MITHHFLIGTPSSGKSTFAQHLIELIPTARIVSTDATRAVLFGDERIQGDWALVEQNVVAQIRACSSKGQPVIYDATNAKPEWRQSILKQATGENVRWIAWHLQTPLALCKAWNKQRSRQVPETVIEEFFHALQEFPPSAKEGFAIVNRVSVTERGFDIARVERQLQDFHETSIARDAGGSPNG